MGSDIKTCPHCGTKNRVKTSLLHAVCGLCKGQMAITYYEILRVSQTASEDEIKKAYRQLAFKWHPDRNQGNDKAHRVFQIISEVYSVLSNIEKRKEYDRSLALKRMNSNDSFKEEYAAKLFVKEMFAYAEELARDQQNTQVIAAQLVKRGCPPTVAAYLANSCITLRNSRLRKSEEKRLRNSEKKHRVDYKV